MSIKHSSGHVLTQPQIDAAVGPLNLSMQGKLSRKKLEPAIEAACRAAGCPIPGYEAEPNEKH